MSYAAFRSKAVRVALVALSVVACRTVQPVPAMPEITGIDWRLIQMNASAAVPAEMTARPWIRLDAATRRVTGNFGCNTANGTYTSGINQTLHFGAIATTRRACTDDRMNAQETALGAAMGSVDRYRVIADTLDLLQGDKVLARFRRSP